MEKEPILVLENLTKKIKNTTIIENVNINVMKGDIYGLVGPNGAGKTTTLKLILNLLKPTSGNIRINNVSLSKDAEKMLRNVGAMIEIPKFYENLTGRRNLEVISELYGEEAKKRIDEVLTITEIKDSQYKKVKDYSLGMKQRLAIARAFIHDPDIIILDEPTNGLDPYVANSIRKLIIKLANDYKKTFIISTHQLSEVESMCNRVGIISRGRLIKEFDMDQIKSIKPEDMPFEDFFISLTAKEVAYE